MNLSLNSIDVKDLPHKIFEAIKNLKDEEPAYAADEIVELSEAILLELSAIGLTIYLNQKNQKSVYNDFIFQLFTSKSNSYNAGPIYRWVANMIKEIDLIDFRHIIDLFWLKDKNEKLILNEEINNLSLLRNEVMHGFFVLPPERNIEEAKRIAEILQKLIKLKIFHFLKDENYHFLKNKNGILSFSGSWKICENEWETISKETLFGSLAEKIRFQLSDEFDIENKKWILSQNGKNRFNKIFIDYVSSNEKGAMVYWHRHNSSINQEIGALLNVLYQNNSYLTYFIPLDQIGISFTSNFVLEKLKNYLASEIGILKVNSNNKKAITDLRKQTNKKVILVLKDIHFSLFSDDHLINLADFFYENNIQIIAFGVQYNWLNQFFNQALPLDTKSAYLPEKRTWIKALDNYLRFKGPNKEIEDEKETYDILINIISKILNVFKSENKIIARRFADKYNYPTEYVHEAFSFLNPYFNFSEEEFGLDELDEIYGFPKKFTESTLIYLILERRDIKLEYKHKVLSL